jgi:glutaredoxin
MRCPSCGYVRKAEDLAPEWQCPSCQIVYEKATQGARYAHVVRNSTSQAVARQSSGPSIPFGTIFTVALLGLVLYFGYSFFSGITIVKETSGNMAEVSPVVAPEKTVLLYSRVGCGYCVKAKNFLQEHKIAFEEIDINTSERGKEDFQKLGAIGVPILIVADIKVIGFDKAELERALKKKGLWK